MMRNKRKNTVFIFIVLFSLYPAWGQNDFEMTDFTRKSHWRMWTVEDGLSISFSNVSSVGKNGRLWTYSGVKAISCFDGYTISQIPFENWLLPNEILLLPIEEGPNDLLWGLLKNKLDTVTGLACYDLKREEWQRYEIDGLTFTFPTTRPAPYDGWGKFLPIGEDRIIAVIQDRLILIRPSQKNWTSLKNFADTQLGNFHCVFHSRDGGIWISAEHGMAKWKPALSDDSLFEWQEFPFPDDLEISDLDFISESPHGEVTGSAFWKPENKRVAVRFYEKKWEILYVGKDDINQVWRSEDGIIWIKETYSTVTLRDRQVISLEKNISEHFGYPIPLNNETFAIGGFFGLGRRSPCLWETPVEMASINSPFSPIYEDAQGRLWFLNIYNLVLNDHGEWRIYDLPKAYQDSAQLFFPKGLFSLPDGRLALPSANGLLTFNPQTEEFETINHPQYEKAVFIASLPNGHAAVATLSDQSLFETLEWFDGNRFERIANLSEFHVYGNGLRDVCNPAPNEYWFGIALEGDQYSTPVQIKDGKWSIYKREEGYPNTSAWSFLPFPNGRMWISSRNQIAEFDGTQWKVIKTNLNETQRLLQARDGSIWAATWGGVRRFKDGSWVTHTEEEGLPDRTVWNVYEDSQGRIWAATNKGISYYNPQADRDLPETYLPEDKNMKTISSEGVAQFVFSGRDKWDYTEASRLYYSYRLDGEDWTEYSTETVITKSNLQPGKHTFEVRAMDRNWNVDPTPELWRFDVFLPWYKEPFFIFTISVSSLLALLFAAYAFNRHTLLKKANKNLNGTVDQLNQANSELQQVNAQLVQLDQMKSAFVSQASHDLRTPLTAIKGSLDNLLLGIAGNLNEKQERIMSRAVKSVDRLTDLVNDVLDLSRIESGRMVLEESNVPIKTLVENIINENRPAAEQKRIQLTANLESDAIIQADAGKLERVVGELISNAIKYTPEGGNVDVFLTQTDDNVTLSVKDSGIGMTQGECEKIWERFYRTNSSKSVAKGSGLGLSIAKELVEMHGGSLEVESKVGEGAEFRLLLSLGGRG